MAPNKGPAEKQFQPLFQEEMESNEQNFSLSSKSELHNIERTEVLDAVMLQHALQTSVGRHLK